eukprot:TRINITY_DN44893_c0_g1_i1.p1 TRINITY_DN44893_c0_g1~~TRINITY_DN44893_c0_g1_i1.p1  ORF type:complete len:460 (+),score=133.53 TRINITY_DN44893_c0_g1_i1:100-1479(+)
MLRSLVGSEMCIRDRFHLAGRANDPAVADAESVIQDLCMNLPRISLVPHIKDPAVWDQWSTELCQRLGFDENKHATGPIIWSAGRIIGDATTLKAYVRRIYGRCITKEYEELQVLARENLRLCLARDKAQAARKSQVAELRDQSASLSHQIESLQTESHQANQTVSCLAAEWDARVAVSLDKLDHELPKVLQRDKLSVELHKLLKLVSRVYQQGQSPRSLSALYGDEGTAQGLIGWLNYNTPSPLLTLQSDDEATTEVLKLLTRACHDLSAHDDHASESEECDLARDLRSWCHSVQAVLNWEGLANFAEALVARRRVAGEFEAVVTQQEALACRIEEITEQIAVHSDPCDAQASASCNMPVNKLVQLSLGALAEAVWDSIDTSASGFVGKNQMLGAAVMVDLGQEFCAHDAVGLWNEAEVRFEDFKALVEAVVVTEGEDKVKRALAEATSKHGLTVKLQ